MRTNTESRIRGVNKEARHYNCNDLTRTTMMIYKKNTIGFFPLEAFGVRFSASDFSRRIRLSGGACRETPCLCCTAARRRLRHCGCRNGHSRHRRSSRRNCRVAGPDMEQDKEPDKELDSSADPTLPGLSSALPNSSSDLPAGSDFLTQTRTRYVYACGYFRRHCRLASCRPALEPPCSVGRSLPADVGPSWRTCGWWGG
jgi:hypothetical protein